MLAIAAFVVAARVVLMPVGDDVATVVAMGLEAYAGGSGCLY